MIWICVAATGPQHFIVIESTINSSICQSTVESNVRPSVQQPKIGHGTGQLFQAHQQIYNRKSENDKNKSFEMGQSKSRL